MNQKNFAIGVLSTTAAIMLVGLAVITSRPDPAQASGMTAAGGDYIMSVATSTQTDEEFVFVVDVPSQKMIAYRFDASRGTVDLLQGFDLSIFRQTQGQNPNQPPRRQP